MKPRSFGPVFLMPRSFRRSTACRKVTRETEKAMWCTQPGSVGVRRESGLRSSLVKTVTSRPSPGSKERWLSFGLSRLGCSKTKGIPSRPSQKSIEVCRSAPTSVMWWTPCDCSLRMVIHVSSLVLDELRLVFAALERAERHQLDARREDQRFPNAPLDRRGEALGCCGTLL